MYEVRIRRWAFNTKEEIEETYNIAIVRIHVETRIARIKMYSIHLVPLLYLISANNPPPPMEWLVLLHLQFSGPTDYVYKICLSLVQGTIFFVLIFTLVFELESTQNLVTYVNTNRHFNKTINISKNITFSMFAHWGFFLDQNAMALLNFLNQTSLSRFLVISKKPSQKIFFSVDDCYI